MAPAARMGRHFGDGGLALALALALLDNNRLLNKPGLLIINRLLDKNRLLDLIRLLNKAG